MRISVLAHRGLAHFEIMSQWRLLHTLDVNFLRYVAPQSQAPPFIPKSHEMVACLDCRISQRYSALRGNSCERCRKLTFAGEKLRVSAVQSSITCLLSIAALAIHLPYSNREMNGIHPLEKKYFAVTKIQEKIRSVREKNRSGCISQRRNGSGFGYMAARPYTMSQRWRCLATQTNTLPSMSWLWFIGRVWPDRGGAAHL